ncbi:MAG: TIR domain-containing protein [Sideroxydans sp.]|nr:TIR domain-containing protein [Sideroxydans sp.]
MSTRQIHVFISHAWAYSQHYDTLATWIFKEPWSVGQASLDFHDYSVPKDNPIHNAPNTQALQQAIFNQIARSHVVVIPSGMYANHSKWIQKEIKAAKDHNKPILAVSPWAQEKNADIVVSNADNHVGWNKQPLINAIWNLYYAKNK